MTSVGQWMLRFRSAATHPKTFRFLLGQFFWRTGCGRGMTFRVRDFRLRLFPTNLSWQLWLDPTSRDTTLNLVHRLAGPGETVVDVGANIGAVSLEAALRVGPGGTVHAVEPHPRIARYLKANLALNHASRVQCHEVAVGPVPTRATLTDDRRDDMNYLRDSEAGKVRGIDVTVTPLDELLPSLPECHLLKLDVEGRELECLHGARHLLQRTRFVLVEAGDSNSRRFGSTAADLHQKLTEDGFTVFVVDEGRLDLLSSGKQQETVCDWIAAREPESLLRRWSE
ncbi:MAG TPA: FkbM family methyltransferase [Verrucomicrobiaceae bacterium]